MPTILGLYTVSHVVISLAAIAVGIPAIAQMLHGSLKSTTIFWFFSLTTLTCLTGFGFPITSITPAHIVGVITLALLAVSYFARRRSLISRRWYLVFLLAAIAAQYLNTFVLIVQSFQKIPALHALAPTQTELPFVVAQLLIISLFAIPVWKSITAGRSWTILFGRSIE